MEEVRDKGISGKKCTWENGDKKETEGKCSTFGWCLPFLALIITLYLAFFMNSVPWLHVHMYVCACSPGKLSCAVQQQRSDIGKTKGKNLN